MKPTMTTQTKKTALITGQDGSYLAKSLLKKHGFDVAVSAER